MSEPKEVFYFVVNDFYRRGPGYYDAHFKHAGDESLQGEATPSYIYKNQLYETSVKDYIWSEGEDSITRMARDVPGAKIIISMRNPFDNAQSNFEKAKVVGTEDPRATLEGVFEEEEKGVRKPEDIYRCYLYLTRYSAHIRHLLDHFPREQILFLLFEDWTQNQQQAMNDIAAFLGLNPCDVSGKDVFMNEGKSVKAPALHRLLHSILPRHIANPLFLRLGAAKGYEAADPATRTRLLEKYYSQDIAETEKLTGLDLSGWLKPS